MKVAIHDQCLKTFNQIKMKEIDARYLIFKLIKENDGKEQIRLDRVGKKEENWGDFLAQLPPKEFRFCVYDLHFTNTDNMNIAKLFFCNWNPDIAPLKIRVAYATAKENFRSHLDLNGKEITLNSADDINEANLIKEFDK